MTRNTKLLIGITILGLLLVYKDWLALNIIKGGEWQYYFSESLKTKYHTGAWISNISLGHFNNVITYRFPLETLLSFFGFINLDSRYADFFAFYLPIVFGFPVASYYSGKYIFKFNVVANIIFICALSFNTYFLYINSAGHLHINVSSIAGIMAVFIYIQFLKKKRNPLIIISALLLFISGIYDFRPTYLSIITMLFYTAYYSYLYERIDQKNIIHKIKEFFTNYKYFLAEIIIVSLLLSYWLIPVILTNTLNSNDAVNRDMFGGEYFDILQAMTLHHPYWNGSEPMTFIKNIPPLYFWLIPLFSFLGIYVNRKNKSIVFFATILAIGILFTKQSAMPFTAIYDFMFKNIPGFNAFRESSKFFFLVALGYSITIAAFVNWLWKKRTLNIYKIYCKYFLTLVIALLFIWNTKPIITREINTMFNPRYINNDYLIFRNFILGQSQYFRTLWVPTVSSWSTYTNKHPKISEVSDLASLYSENKGNNGDALINLFDESNLEKNFNSLAIKYVVIPIKDEKNDDNPFQNFGNDREKYITKLDKVFFLKRINIGLSDLVVYENSGHKPLIYLTNQMESINKDISFSNVKYTQISTSEYKIELGDISNTVYVNFSDTFNSNWKMRLGRFSWINTLFENKYFISDEFHHKTNNNLNSFEINPNVLCQNQYYENTNVCEKSPNGYKINLTLYFLPQSFFYLGLIISGSTLATSLAYLYRKLYVKRT